MTRVYVDSRMETTVTDNGHTRKMTTTKTRGFNSRVTAARWLARRELQQRIAREYNPQNNEEWQVAIMKIFPADPHPYWYYSQTESRKWITNRAAEIVKEWEQ